MKSGFVEEPTSKAFVPAAALIFRKAFGVVVPMPTLPAPVIMKCVAVDEPTTNSGTPDPIPFGLIERRPQGVDVPKPERPVFLTTK